MYLHSRILFTHRRPAGALARSLTHSVWIRLRRCHRILYINKCTHSRTDDNNNKMWVLLHWRGVVVGVCAQCWCVCNLSFTFFSSSGVLSQTLKSTEWRRLRSCVHSTFVFAEARAIAFWLRESFFTRRFVHAWMLYRFLWIPLLSLYLGRHILRGSGYSRVDFFTAWNWSMTLQNAFLKW